MLILHQKFRILSLFVTVVYVFGNVREIIFPDELAMRREAAANKPALAMTFPMGSDRCGARGWNRTVTECSLRFGLVFYKGSCRHLLQQGPCPSQNWLVMDNYGNPTCKLQICSERQVLLGGSCITLNLASSARECGSSLELIINEFGEAECECPINTVYHPVTKRCYQLYEQGPCRNGHTIQLVNKGFTSYADCRPNLCHSPGEVAMTTSCEEIFSLSNRTAVPPTHEYSCYKMHTPGPCREGYLTVDFFSLKTICSDNVPYALYASLPSSRCSRGSKRDTRNRCRNDNNSLTVTDSPPTIPTGDYGDGNVCPASHILVPELNACLQLQNGA